MDFSLLFVQQSNQFIVLLDGLQRLNKNRLAAGTGAMDYSLHAALLLDLDRDHETLAANGHQLFLNGAAFGEMPQIITQRVLDGAFLLFDIAANARQLRRG